MDSALGLLIIVAILYFAGRYLQRRSTTVTTKPLTFNTRLSSNQFEDALNKYKILLKNSNNDAKNMEEIAEKFELKFYLRAEIFDFFAFLEEKFNKADSLGITKNWWQSKLINQKNIHVDDQKYNEFKAKVNLDNLQIQYRSARTTHYDEFDTSRSVYDPTYYDFERSISVGAQGIVYEVTGRDYRVEYHPPIIPNYTSVAKFKPSNWLLKVHNFLCDFQQEKSAIDSKFKKIEEDQSLRRAKKKYAV